MSTNLTVVFLQQFCAVALLEYELLILESICYDLEQSFLVWALT